MRSRCGASERGRWGRTRSDPSAAAPSEGPIQHLVRALAALDAAYSPGHHGRWSARRRADLVDEAVRALAEDLPPGVAVVALGGYGRRSLTPASDVDLMVVHRKRRADPVRSAAERLFYPFWDAGIPLGHAVRTVDECLGEARDALDVTCSLLDLRPLAGDASLADAVSERHAARIRRDPSGFARRLRQDTETRHAARGSCGTSLEPDLKEGAGGLRDLNAVGWLATVTGDDVERADGRMLDDAEEFLVRLRSALRIHTGRRGDVLHREHQPEVAAVLGFDATAGLDAPDALMRALFDHGRRVSDVLERSLSRAAGEAVIDRVPGPLLAAAEEGWTPAAAGSLVDLLASGETGQRAMEALDLTGVLTRLIPAWEAVRCRPQRDPYHRSPVDVHLLSTARIAAEVLAGDDLGDPVLARSGAAVVDRDALLLGALFHDIGKRGEGRHVEIGERVAAEALRRMGIGDPTRDRILFLVREHLLLSDTATRRDLADHDLVLDVAARVGDPERLALLHVITVADAEATGPHAATPWRLGLVRELVTRVEHVLESGEMDATRGVELDRKRREIASLLTEQPKDAVDSFLGRLPRPYVLAVTPRTAADHFALVVPPPGRAEVRTSAIPGERSGTWRLTVVASDRPGLLARIAGSLALSGLSILSAQAFTTGDGTALDLFDVMPAFEGDIDEERWRAVRQTLRRALDGRISLEYRVREKRRHYPAARVDVPTEVRVLNDASDFATVVEVETADRVGLLFDLARTFEELHLDVSLAKVATYGPRVVDAFYVTHAGEGKVEDPEVTAEIERAIRSRLAD